MLFDNPPSHETIRSEVQLLVDRGNIQAIRELDVEGQERFLEIADQVSAIAHLPFAEGCNLRWPRR